VKVVAFNGSARKDGNTALLLRRVLRVLETEGIETELIQLAEVTPAEPVSRQRTIAA
jgi:multimeric flavodoxin WrbA